MVSITAALVILPFGVSVYFECLTVPKRDKTVDAFIGDDAKVVFAFEFEPRSDTSNLLRVLPIARILQVQHVRRDAQTHGFR